MVRVMVNLSLCLNILQDCNALDTVLSISTANFFKIFRGFSSHISSEYFAKIMQ